MEAKGTESGKELKELRRAFERRWKNIVEKGKKFEKGIPEKEELWLKVLRSFNSGFICPYCRQALLIKDSVPPYGKSFSLGHKISLWLGGGNTVDNIAIVCTRCNQVKGTMTEETFVKVIGAVRQVHGDSLLERMFKEVYSGRLADKISRESNLKKKERL